MPAVAGSTAAGVALQAHSTAEWYSHQWYDGQRYRRVVRSTRCEGVVEADCPAAEWRRCRYCVTVGRTNSFKGIVRRLTASGGGPHRHWRKCTHEQLGLRVQKERKRAHNRSRGIRRLRQLLLRATGKVTRLPLVGKALENAKRQEVRTLLVVIKQLREDGTFKKSKELAIDIAHDILKNASDVLSPRGQRYSDGTKAWLGILRTNMGRRCSDMVTVNAGLASERTSRGWSTEKQTFSCQLTDEDFAYVAKVYEGQMAAANLPWGSIPVVLAEDETKITPKAEFDHATKSIVGFCGVKCAAKCTTAPMCRMAKCVNPHGCRDGYDIPYPATTRMRSSSMGTGTAPPGRWREQWCYVHCTRL